MIAADVFVKKAATILICILKRPIPLDLKSFYNVHEKTFKNWF